MEGEKAGRRRKNKRAANKGRRKEISKRKIEEFYSGVRARVDKADAVFVYILLFSFEVLVEKR